MINSSNTFDVIRAWLSSLVEADFHCETHLRGTPGRMRIPAGWSVKMAFPGEHLFYFPLEGRLAGFEDGVEFCSGPGELIWVPAGVPFHFWLPPGEKLYLCRFRLSTSRPITGSPALPIRFPVAGNCRLWMERLALEAETTKPQAASCHAERIRGLLLCLFTELARIERSAGPEPVNSRLTGGQQNTIRDFLAERAAHLPEVPWPGSAELARHLRLSPDYFTRLFTRTYGQPPRRWLLEQRVRLAALRLAESRLNVSEVAAEFGYENVFLFSRQFRQVMGQSPSQYRADPGLITRSSKG